MPLPYRHRPFLGGTGLVSAKVQRMLTKKKAIVVIQAHLRAFVCQTEFQLATDGATHIQRVARGMRARRFVKYHQVAVMKAVLTIQAGAHGMRARRR
eukprot:3474793-Amphidinium_carterae.1